MMRNVFTEVIMNILMPFTIWHQALTMHGHLIHPEKKIFYNPGTGFLHKTFLRENQLA